MMGTLEQDLGASAPFGSIFAAGEPPQQTDGMDIYCVDLRETVSCVTEPPRISSTGVAPQLDPLAFAVSEPPTSVWPTSGLDAPHGNPQAAGLSHGGHPLSKHMRPASSFTSLAFQMDAHPRDVSASIPVPPQLHHVHPVPGSDTMGHSVSNHVVPQTSSVPIVNSSNLQTSLDALYALRAPYSPDLAPSVSLVSSASLESSHVEAMTKGVTESHVSLSCPDAVRTNADPLAPNMSDPRAHSRSGHQIVSDFPPERIPSHATLCATETESVAAGTTVQRDRGDAVKMTITKQRRRYNQPRSSKYCHLCARHERAVEMIACGNLFRGLCQKSVCRKCFTTYNMDWQAARASFDNLASGAMPREGGMSRALAPGTGRIHGVERQGVSDSPNVWQCPHCVGTCPKRAKCFAYDRQTVRRRAKTQEARLRANSPAIGLSS